MTDPTPTPAEPPTQVGVTDSGTPVYDQLVQSAETTPADPPVAGSAPATETTAGDASPTDTTATPPTTTADAPADPEPAADAVADAPVEQTAEASAPADPSAALPDAASAEGTTGSQPTTPPPSNRKQPVTAITPDNPPEPAQNELFAEHDSDDLGIGRGFGQGVAAEAFPNQPEAFISEVPERDDDVTSDTVTASPKWVAYRNFGQYKLQQFGWVGPEGLAFGVDELDEFKAFVASL
jgi:hypothetical protein